MKPLGREKEIKRFLYFYVHQKKGEGKGRIHYSSSFTGVEKGGGKGGGGDAPSGGRKGRDF